MCPTDKLTSEKCLGIQLLQWHSGNQNLSITIKQLQFLVKLVLTQQVLIFLNNFLKVSLWQSRVFLSCKVAIFNKATIMACEMLWGGPCNTTGKTGKAKAGRNQQEGCSDPFNQNKKEPIEKDNKVFKWELFFFFFFNFYLFIFIFVCVGSSFLCKGFLQLRQAGAALHRGARASHYRGLSCCGAQAPDAQAQQLWPTGLVAPWHVRSSQTRARTRVPCIGRQILNRCATREALKWELLI